MGHHSTLIGGGKGEGCLFCSNAHKIVASVVNVLTRIQSWPKPLTTLWIYLLPLTFPTVNSYRMTPLAPKTMLSFAKCVKHVMGHHSTLIGGGKGEGCLFCSNAHKIVASVVNVLTRIVALARLSASLITSQCKYPGDYKHGLVTPVPKVCPPADVSNDFRQISVLPHIGKILERVQLQLNQNDILRPSQNGFTSGHSTTLALISITQPWFNATDNTCRDKVGIHALFIDFKKAFDLIDHGMLLIKLALMNVNKSFWLWVNSF